MRHLDSVRKFNKDREHRRAMFSNMMTSFFTHERITTTLAKAKELRRLSEKAITRAKENSLHNKRMIMRRIHDRDVVAKLFDEIAPKYREVNGGYTRILKLGNRAGDGADLARIELVDPAESAEKKKAKGGPKGAPSRRPAARKSSAKSAPTPAAGQPEKPPSATPSEKGGAGKKKPPREGSGRAGGVKPAPAAANADETPESEAPPSPDMSEPQGGDPAEGA